MPSVRSLRCQHDQASRMMLQLINLIEAHRSGGDTYLIALRLTEWVSLLRAHLACEDEWFYPALIASRDSRSAATALQFKLAMGGLAEQLEAFARNWSSSVVIAAAFPRFRDEAFALFARLERRIIEEDQTLYPLAEAAGIGRVSSAA